MRASLVGWTERGATADAPSLNDIGACSRVTSMVSSSGSSTSRSVQGASSEGRAAGSSDMLAAVHTIAASAVPGVAKMHATIATTRVAQRYAWRAPDTSTF